MQRQLDITRADTIERVRSAVFEFMGEQRQDDDLSMVELTVKPLAAPLGAEAEVGDTSAAKAFPFSIEVKVDAQAMRSEASLSVVADMLGANASLRPFKGVLYTIISELYTNALEHGILGLDSARKRDDTSYVGYYSEKKRALDALSNAHIAISCTFCDDGRRVKIKVVHDGAGDSLKRMQGHDARQMHGWGLHIVEELCQSIDYHDQGRCVEVTYDTGAVQTASAPA